MTYSSALRATRVKPREAIERYAGAGYTQHNPRVDDGKEAVIAYFEHWNLLPVVPGASANGNTMF